MLITSKISFNEYLKLLFSLAYKKPLMRLLVIVAFLTLAWVAVYDFHVAHLPKPSFYQYILLAIIIFIQPVGIYLTIKKNYYSSAFLNETLTIEFTQKQVKITGDSLYVEQSWHKIYRIEELKKYFLIYENNLSAIIVPKKSLENREEELRQFFTALPPESVRLKAKPK